MTRQASQTHIVNVLRWEMDSFNLNNCFRSSSASSESINNFFSSFHRSSMSTLSIHEYFVYFHTWLCLHFFMTSWTVVIQSLVLRLRKKISTLWTFNNEIRREKNCDPKCEQIFPDFFFLLLCSLVDATTSTLAQFSHFTFFFTSLSCILAAVVDVESRKTTRQKKSKSLQGQTRWVI